MSDLVTLAEVKTYLGIDHSDDDDLFEGLIDYFTQGIETYLNRSFTQSSFTEYHDGGARDLIVKNRPIDSITSIIDTDDDSTLSSDNYDFDPEAGTIWLSEENTLFIYGSTFPDRKPACWSSGRRRWKVTYVGGFDGAPDDIKLAALLLIASRYRDREGDKTGERIGDYQYTLNAPIAGVLTMAPDARSILDKYKDLWF